MAGLRNIFKAVLLLVLILPCPAYSQPAGKIDILPDFQNNILHIKIKHLTSNPFRYYIRMVDIIIDDLPMIRKFYLSQPITRGGYVYIDIPVDKLSRHKTVIIKAYPKQGVMKEKTFNLDDFKKSGQKPEEAK